MAITGFLQAIISTATVGSPSYNEGRMPASTSRNHGQTFGCDPTKSPDQFAILHADPVDVNRRLSSSQLDENEDWRKSVRSDCTEGVSHRSGCGGWVIKTGAGSRRARYERSAVGGGTEGASSGFL